mmetsp:Transcript_21527/g.54240  ORF Transcript_21527/g.54240 Transcript_21527/m.54240 type:complete len:215 (-) Transcript_21527:477-1121(-)|eukprot:g7391.t1
MSSGQAVASPSPQIFPGIEMLTGAKSDTDRYRTATNKEAINGAGARTSASSTSKVENNEPDPRLREKICNDVLNTSVMAAIVGGFALSNMQQTSEPFPADVKALQLAIYVCSFLAVHACTCSALTSAFVYRHVNNMADEERLARWVNKYEKIVMLPLAKFGMGCLSYMLSVILISYKELEFLDVWRFLCLGIGLMSMSMVFVTVFVLNKSNKEP